MINRMARVIACFALCVSALSLSALAAEATFQRNETFDSDPHWDGFRNQLLPARLPVIEQDFGYRDSHFAGGQCTGEIGGRVQRSTTPASFFRRISPLTLEDSFSASGRFAVRHADGGSGVMLGWFHESSKGWRTSSSVAMRIDGNGGNYWVFWEYGTESGKTGGAGAFEGRRYQTTKTKPYPGDGTSHRFSLTYDPQGAKGNGTLALTIDDQSFPSVEFPEAHRREGMTLDRFGIWNVEIAGAPLEFYVDDLILNGEQIQLDQDAGWEGKANHVKFTDHIVRPFHDFGFQSNGLIRKDHGELGGIIFRDEKPAYYAREVGQLSLNDALHASGTIQMHSSAADSGFCLGWFGANAKREHEQAEYHQPSSDLLAVMIEGPSRVGHWFRASYRTSQRQGIIDGNDVNGDGPLPVLRCDNKVHQWELHYDPSGDEGRGTIEVIFDDQRRRFPLRPGDRQQGAVFDHFGVFNIQAGGHHVVFSIDRLQYTSRR